MLIWIWTAFSIALLAWLSYSMFEFEDKSLFMPGPLTDGHHQIGVACSACHTDPLADGELIQKACLNCHAEDREKPFDSHPRSKFTDPRNADTLGNIDALRCVTCHREHSPDMSAAKALIAEGKMTAADFPDFDKEDGVFPMLWGVLAAQVQTSLGVLPGPAKVWEQMMTLTDEHRAEREKEVTFYQCQETRSAENWPKTRRQR